MESFSCVQLFAGNDADEFNAVLKQQITPKVLITTCRFNSGVCVFYATYIHDLYSCPYVFLRLSTFFLTTYFLLHMSRQDLPLLRSWYTWYQILIMLKGEHMNSRKYVILLSGLLILLLQWSLFSHAVKCILFRLWNTQRIGISPHLLLCTQIEENLVHIHQVTGNRSTAVFSFLLTLFWYISQMPYWSSIYLMGNISGAYDTLVHMMYILNLIHQF
jgi:hypothetical protein